MVADNVKLGENLFSIEFCNDGHVTDVFECIVLQKGKKGPHSMTPKTRVSRVGDDDGSKWISDELLFSEIDEATAYGRKLIKDEINSLTEDLYKFVDATQVTTLKWAREQMKGKSNE